MSADLSRIRFNPLADYSGVELKQGGVLLDADFNEWVAVLDRRLRAAASDILGPARVSSTTPDAFKITLAGGQPQIGIGRLYVDGLLAENHGLPAAALAKKPFDPLLGEQRFADAVPYGQQPYLPQPPALPAAGKHLIYLDVWQRELTHVEQPALVEPAVNVETSSRLQTVWQVRVLADAAGANATCATPDGELAGWSAVTAPSIARLSTGTHEVTGAVDPCELPPTGGYRGLENQTYRVEVHDAGTPGGGAGNAATFKWSRDNASIARRVTSIVSAHELMLADFGRDDVLRFNSGDWVEITDDAREFSQRAGELRRITVDEARRTLRFTPDLPAAMLPPAATPLPDAAWPAQSNLRVKRWDQAHQVLRVMADGSTSVWHDLDAAGATGAIPVPGPGTTLLLERGVTVRFTSAAGVPNGRFRAGDYWVFAARTADASVEGLAEAAPRGIHHHYARLAMWDLASGQLSDCRLPWPPPVGAAGHDCSCTACVTPQSHASGTLTIQAAVDRVIAAGGGTVCLAIGRYALVAPVRIRDGLSFTLRGQGVGTLLGASGTAIAIEGGGQIRLEDFSIVSGAQSHVLSTDGAVMGLEIERLTVLAGAANDKARASAAIALGGLVLGARIRDNFIVAANGIIAGGTEQVKLTTGNFSVPGGYLISALLHIEGNALVCRRYGIDFSGVALHALGHVVADNQLIGCAEAGMHFTGVVVDGQLQLRGNGFAAQGPGIVAGVDGLLIAENRLDASPPSGAKTHTGDAIALVTGLDSNGPNECQVLANQVSGFGGAALRVSAPVRDLIAKLNIVRRCEIGIAVEDEGAVARVAIENNDLSDIGVDPAGKGTAAIAVARADTATIAGNRVQRVGARLGQGTLGLGISTMGVQRIAIRGNQVLDVVPAAIEGFGIAVQVKGPFRHADVAGNQIDRDAVARYDAQGRYSSLFIGSDAAGSVAAGNQTLVVGAKRAYVYSSVQGAGDVAAARGVHSALPHAGVQGNTIGSRGSLPAVVVQVDGDCLFGDNRVEHRSDKQQAVQLAGDVAVVQGNRVHNLHDVSVAITTSKGKDAAAVLGNITTGAIVLNNGPVPAPFAALNLKR